jgi:hypothetical protein
MLSKCVIIDNRWMGIVKMILTVNQFQFIFLGFLRREFEKGLK